MSANSSQVQICNKLAKFTQSEHIVDDVRAERREGCNQIQNDNKEVLLRMLNSAIGQELS